MDLALTGHRAVVTGATSGIGLEIVRRLAEEGAAAAGIGRNLSPLGDLGERVLPVAGDLSTAEGCADAAERALGALGGVDLVVNCLGLTPSREGFLEVQDDDWRDVFELNFMSTVRMTRSLLPPMVEQGGGTIVNVSSVSAKQPTPALVDYAAMKAAMTNLTKSLALEFAPHHIRVNSVSPGPVRTATWDAPGGLGETLGRRYGMPPDAAIDHFVNEVRQLPMGMGEPGDVASLVCFLASPAAGKITGADHLIVDTLRTI